MGQSIDKLVYQRVKNGNIDGIRSLHASGAGLEWMDNKGKTPLIVACMDLELYNVAETLIELGAKVNAYRPGRHAGTPLHHAVKQGLDRTVELLLSHGANALVTNEDVQTPLEVARVNGYTKVARTIEAHICLFSGWLKELYETVHRQAGRFTRINTSREVWVMVLPYGSADPRKPFKFELVIYIKYHPNRTAAVLCEANIEEPDFNQPEPVVVISDTTTVPGTRLRFAALTENDEQLLRSFYNACKGIRQANPPAPVGQSSAPPISEDDELAMAVQASLQSSTIQGPDPGPGPGPGPDPSSSTIHSSSSNPVASSSGTANNSKQDVPDTGIAGVPTAVEHITCVICLDAPVEGACIPCGHMACCMSCLNEIKAKNWGCPVCRANIKLVSRIYSV